jgi:hypothetical protein
MVQKQNEQLLDDELIFRAFLSFTHPTAPKASEHQLQDYNPT